MSKLFEMHPLPWSINVRGGSSDYLVDALGKEISLQTREVREGIKQMSASINGRTKRSLGGGQKSNRLFVIKDTFNGTYMNNKSIVRTQHYRSEYQAKRAASRANRYNNATNRYVVVELKIDEKCVV